MTGVFWNENINPEATRVSTRPSVEMTTKFDAFGKINKTHTQIYYESESQL